jgi:hypothetical protein
LVLQKILTKTRMELIAHTSAPYITYPPPLLMEREADLRKLAKESYSSTVL